jgi:hypothetical protein
MTAAEDLYKRPDRDEIRDRVLASLPGAGKATGGNRPGDGTSAAVRNFAVHLSARMRALGWDQSSIQDRAGITAQTAARAINGTGVGLDLAEKIAVLVGLTLAVMIGPYTCRTCSGEPPHGFACLECGTEGDRQ